MTGAAGSATLEEQNITTWSFAEEEPADEAIRRDLGARETELTVRLSRDIHLDRLIGTAFTMTSNFNAVANYQGASDPSNMESAGHRQVFADVVGESIADLFQIHFEPGSKCRKRIFNAA